MSLEGKKSIIVWTLKNDNYYHLITATEREASWIHLFHFNDNLKIQSSFKSKPKFSAIS